jgi:signal peptidase I
MNSSATAANQPSRPSWLRIVLIGRKPKNTLIRIVVLVAVCFVVFNFILLPIRVDGISMLSTYRDGQINFVNRLAYRRHEPQRGDVVSIRLADLEVSHPHVLYMKRIVGLPGETVSFVGGQLLIDGKVLDETYVKKFCDWEIGPVKLEPDQYFVVGDNRSMPEALHKKGGAYRWQIMGKVLL